jgi:hypothetical protein
MGSCNETTPGVGDSWHPSIAHHTDEVTSLYEVEYGICLVVLIVVVHCPQPFG